MRRSIQDSTIDIYIHIYTVQPSRLALGPLRGAIGLGLRLLGLPEDHELIASGQSPRVLEHVESDPVHVRVRGAALDLAGISTTWLERTMFASVSSSVVRTSQYGAIMVFLSGSTCMAGCAK